MGNVFDELKRRKVFRVAAAYAVSAWVLIQIAGEVLPTFDAPAWVNQTLIFLFMLGFPIAIILAWAYDVTPQGIQPDNSAPPQQAVTHSSDHKLIYATFALVLLVAGFQVSERFLERGESSEPGSLSTSSSIMRAEIPVEHALPRRFTGVRSQLGISPDGTYLSYGNLSPGRALEIYLKNLATNETRLLTDGASLGTIPQFSSDGQLVLLNANPNALIAPVSGGLPQIVEIGNVSGRVGSVNWYSENEILFVSSGIIHLHNLVSGEERQVTEQNFERDPVNPFLIPGTGAILFTSVQNVGSQNFNNANIDLFNPETNTTQTLVRGGYLPKFVPTGHIVFIRDGDLWAVPFSTESLDLAGAETRVLEDIDSQPRIGMAGYAISNSGRLVYLQGPEVDLTRSPYVWVDREGNEELSDIAPGIYKDPELSPDGRSLSLTVGEQDGDSDIWIFDLVQGGAPSRRTFTGDAMNAKWIEGGSRFVYQRGVGELWIANANGSGQPERIRNNAGELASPVWYSQSDNSIGYLVGSAGTADLHTLAYLDSTWVSKPLVESEFDTWDASVSPDGRWIAYHGNESGRLEIYVSPYPDVENGLYQLSTAGGREPKWGPNSDELFYLQLGVGELMSVNIYTESGFTHSPPQFLSTYFLLSGGDPPSYAVSPDGNRFLGMKFVNEAEFEFDYSEEAVFTVVENWFEELKRLSPPDQASDRP